MKVVTAPLNPRRDIYPTDEDVGSEQVEWEFTELMHADLILFWFPKETLCPITLFELGAWASKPNMSYRPHKPLIVGCHPEYERIWDVEKQLSLVRPDVKVYSSLSAVTDQVYDWYEKTVL